MMRLKPIRNVFSVFAAACLLLSCSGGSDEPNNGPSLSEDRIESPANGRNASVTIETNGDWTARPSQSWIVVSPTSGTGHSLLSVTVNANKSTASRSGKITVTANGQPAEIAVEQAGAKPSTDPEPIPNFRIDASQGSCILPAGLTAMGVNVDFTGFTVSGLPAWITRPENQQETQAFGLQLQPNTTKIPRSAEITVANGSKSEMLTITQCGVADLTIGDDGSAANALAFPGAEGGGRFTTGGRGGKVLYVTNLNDSGTGSLRWAVEQSGARTVLFKVSGVIELKSRLNINNGNLTIAGQSAPGDGICLRNYETVVNAGNVIIRFIRFRPGDGIADTEPDAIWGRYQEDIILDHCTMGWSVDECASFYANKNFTMQWCILHEGLMLSNHVKGSHSYGGLWGGYYASFHHNLLIHNNSRNPRFNGYKRSGLSYNNPQPDEIMDFRNNVLYNWGDNSGYGGEAAGHYNVVNNYYRSGAGTSNGSKNRIVQIDKDGGTTITPLYGTFHVTGNVMHNNASITANNPSGITNKSGADLSQCTAVVPFAFSAVTTHSASDAYERVLDYGGASFARDVIDQRLVREARNGTTTYTGSKSKRNGLIDTPSDAEGWTALNYRSPAPLADADGDGIPDVWEEAYGLDKNKAADGNGKTLDPKGVYTNLEVYLHNLVQHIVQAQNQGGTVLSSKTN